MKEASSGLKSGHGDQALLRRHAQPTARRDADHHVASALDPRDDLLHEDSTSGTGMPRLGIAGVDVTDRRTRLIGPDRIVGYLPEG